MLCWIRTKIVCGGQGTSVCFNQAANLDEPTSKPSLPSMSRMRTGKPRHDLKKIPPPSTMCFEFIFLKRYSHVEEGDEFEKG